MCKDAFCPLCAYIKWWTDYKCTAIFSKTVFDGHKYFSDLTFKQGNSCYLENILQDAHTIVLINCSRSVHTTIPSTLDETQNLRLTLASGNSAKRINRCLSSQFSLFLCFSFVYLSLVKKNYFITLSDPCTGLAKIYSWI